MESLSLANLRDNMIPRAGKKLKMSARGHFEGSEKSSKVCDFRQRETKKKMHQYTVLLIIGRPNHNPPPQYFLNPPPHPQSSTLNFYLQFLLQNHDKSAVIFSSAETGKSSC